MKDEELYETENRDDTDEDVVEIMKNNDLEKEEAEEVKEIMDEWGLDEDEAVEIRDLL